MKNIDIKKTVVLLSFAMIVSCGTKSKQHKDDELQHSGTENTHAHKSDEIHLSAEQVALAGIEIAPFKNQVIKQVLNVSGEIQVPPQSKATVYAPMESFVFKTSLLPGDVVKKGQTIAVLQHPNFIKLQQTYLGAVNNFKVAKADYERKKMLLDSNITSKKSFQAVEAKYLSNESFVKSYAAQLTMVGLSPEYIESNGIQQKVDVKSPIDGYVVENNLNQGKFLAANEEMMEIIDTDHMHAELKVFGADVTRINKGDIFVFKPSGVDKNYEGYIKLISQKVHEDSRTVDVHGHFEDEDKRLKPGMYIEARIFSGGKKGYTIPEEALIENEGVYYVFKAESKNEFVKLKVVAGVTIQGLTEIKSIEGDDFTIPLVVKGAHYLKGVLLQSSGEMEGHAH